MNRANPVRLGAAAAGRCRRRVHLDHAQGAPRAQRLPLDDGVKMRLADTSAHTDQVLARVPGAVGGWSPASSERPKVVRMPNLRSATRVGTPELLVANGDGYLPVIVRGHRTLDPGGRVEISPVDDPTAVTVDPGRRRRRHHGDLLQLAHHYTLLTELGLAAPVPRGGVIGRGVTRSADGSQIEGLSDGDVIVWHDLTEVLDDYATRFSDRQAVATAAAAGGELARPSRISECRRCPWWTVCSAELEAARDISLLAAGSDVTVLHDAGLHTLDDLVAVPTADLEQLPLTSVPAREAKVRALARLSGVPMVRRSADAAARRADVEMDIDMESYLEDGAYLWGTLLSGADIGHRHGYRPFVSFAPMPGAAEAATFAEFWAYLSAVRAACADAGLSFAAYCWSRAAEERWLYGTVRRYPEAPGMPGERQIAEFCASEQWIDLYVEVKRRFVVPGSMRLKSIAPIAGFRWRDAAPGGENSMAWYRAAVDDAAGADRVMRQRILDYNEDDVRATAAIREWMSEGAQALPTVDELLAEANPPIAGAATGEVAGRGEPGRLTGGVAG